eukprot:364929-Chlamydomonas_euryale.AAC.1
MIPDTTRVQAIWDAYVFIPNGLGAVLAVAQLALTWAFPARKSAAAPPGYGRTRLSAGAILSSSSAHPFVCPHILLSSHPKYPKL